MREKRRVCYIVSNPEWFSYAVMRLFYRNPDWLFVPVNDLSENERKEEYRKAQYFFVSGFGKAAEALRAKGLGCTLIGVRADVPVNIPILESKRWDPFGTFALLYFYENIVSTPRFLQPLIRSFFILSAKLYWYAYFGFKMLVHEDAQTILLKLKRFFYL